MYSGRGKAGLVWVRRMAGSPHFGLQEGPLPRVFRSEVQLTVFEPSDVPGYSRVGLSEITHRVMQLAFEG